MDILVRTTTQRKLFVDEYYRKLIPTDFKIMVSSGGNSGEEDFVNALKTCQTDTLILEDDQLLCDDFYTKASTIIEEHKSNMVCLSQMDFGIRQYKKSGLYHPYFQSITTFALYLPYDFIKKVIEYYHSGFNTDGGYYDATLQKITNFFGLEVYYEVPSLTGHIREFKSEMNHTTFFYSYGFDYPTAYKRLKQITGRTIKEYASI